MKRDLCTTSVNSVIQLKLHHSMDDAIRARDPFQGLKPIDRLAEELIKNDDSEPKERVLVETRTDIAAGVNSHGISTVAQYESWTIYGSLESAYLQVSNHLMADLVRARYSGKGA